MCATFLIWMGLLRTACWLVRRWCRPFIGTQLLLHMRALFFHVFYGKQSRCKKDLNKLCLYTRQTTTTRRYPFVKTSDIWTTVSGLWHSGGGCHCCMHELAPPVFIYYAKHISTDNRCATTNWSMRTCKTCDELNKMIAFFYCYLWSLLLLFLLSQCCMYYYVRLCGRSQTHLYRKERSTVVWHRALSSFRLLFATKAFIRTTTKCSSDWFND